MDTSTITHPKKMILVMLEVLLLAGCTLPSSNGNNSAGYLQNSLLALEQGNVYAAESEMNAAATTWISSTIVQGLDHKERTHMASATKKAVSTGQSQTWTDRKTGLKEKVTVIKTVVHTTPHEIAVKKNVVKIPPITLIGKEYVPSQVVNVRNGPGLHYGVIGQLASNEPVKVVGKVVAKPWYLIARYNVADGFVYMSLLHRVSATPSAATSNTPNASFTAQTSQISHAAPKPHASQTMVTKVKTAQICRVVSQEVIAPNGRRKSQTIKACKGPKGWKIVGA